MGKNIIEWGTHLPLLVRMFDKTEGDVLEMGMGHFSTPVLKWLCEMSGRTLYSYESKMDWYEKAASESKPFHKVIFCQDWASADIERHWGLAFIDHSPMRERYIDIKRLANYADIIVIHDTQPQSDWVYRYSKIFPLFKYRLDFSKYIPWTSAVSNFIDVSKLG
ncbi:MAG: hypothetical protein HYW79_00315 [Parcubacteria group bacterium]|nr:hypothetical protein [Parcubacteria group bacterium]